MILSCQHLTKAYGIEEILRDISFHLEEGEKAALIGVNGAGKTTLLRILTGQENADSGVCIIPSHLRIGYLAQYQDLEGDCTIYEEVRKAREDLLLMEADIRQMEASLASVPPEERDSFYTRYESLVHEYERRNGYASESEIIGVLRGLGFSEEDFVRKLSTLSGGQKTRVVLARILLEEPDILLLDEPTNHLDVSSVRWLESRLQKYPGTLLLVSHDRYFLDRLVSHVIEIEHGVSLSFSGNYSAFSLKKAESRRAALHAWEKQQSEIRHQEDVIRKLRQFNRQKSISRAESREKQLRKIDRVEKPSALSADMHLHLIPVTESGKDVCSAEDLQKGFSEEPLFSGLNFLIRRGERVGLIGDNGTGKSTILKILGGVLEPDAGSVRFGSRVHTGYYDQEQQIFNEKNTLFEEISDDYPDCTETEIRNVLASFLFTGDDVFKLISSLSGGERARLSLAKLMLSGANFLLLDEPTNHLDIESREILEDALNDFTGTVLFVSHDRYFINRTATRILELDGRVLTEYLGDYDYYLEKKQEKDQAASSAFSGSAAASGSSASSGSSSVSGISSGKADWQAQKEEQARIRKQQQRLASCEESISETEKKIREIDEQLSLPETGMNLPLCQQLASERSALQETLDALYEEWEVLSLEQEQT